ncbi:MAG: class I SAM-dependent methyltransferase [Proteobacteria bacterium]|nr:MAG: class I SAM-dependent methyltransferase [Pseudomonadota bacterium]
MSEQKLEFTGERFVPECEREIWYEHYHRYLMACDLVSGKKVLDAACGEGYGSHLLATYADKVVAVDIDTDSIHHAKQKYRQDNLKFLCADVLKIPIADNSFDVVVSFETLEHLAEQQQLMAEYKRLLTADGILIISTPDKTEYSDKTGFNNEFHVKELYRHEFKELLDNHFSQQVWLGQKLMFTSTIWQLDTPLNTVKWQHLEDKNTIREQSLSYPPMYYVVVASNKQQTLTTVNDSYLFTEQAESVYGHYHAVIRAHIKAEQDHQALMDKQQKWLNHPIIGRLIRWLDRG